MFYLFLVVMGLLYMYLLLVRKPLFSWVGYNYSSETFKKYMAKEDRCCLVVIGFCIMLWVLTTIDNFVDFIY